MSFPVHVTDGPGPGRVTTARSVWVTRVVLVAGVLTGLLAGVPSGLTPPVVVVVVVALGGGAAALRPEGLAGPVTLGVVLLFWALQLHHQVPASVMVAAAGVLTAHVAATLLAYGPTWMPLPRAVVLLWVVRGLLVWLVAPVIWLVARAYADQATPTSFWLGGLAAAGVAAVVAAVVVPTRGGDR
jgi:hypothetical protein